MSIWQIILVPIVLLVIGLIRQLIILRRKVVRHDLAAGFLDKFIEWCNGKASDHSLYDWMLSKSEAVQAMLGCGGLINLKRPFEHVYHNNIPVILNTIPEIQRMYGDHRFCNGNNQHLMIQTVDPGLFTRAVFCGVGARRLDASMVVAAVSA